jgi:hypothetical protein
MADRSADHYQALLLPDTRFDLGNLAALGGTSVDSSYTQAGARPGVPEASGSEAMELSASGSQSENGSLLLTVQRAGLPVAGGATFVLRDVGAKETASQQYGQESWATVTGYESLIENTGSPTVSQMTPHAITLADGTVLAVIENIESGVGAPFLNFRQYDPASGFTTVTHSHDGASQQSGSALVELPDGSVLCFIVALGGDQIDVLRSTDGGTTWATAAERVLDVAVAVADIRRIGAAHSTGQILLVISYYDGANYTAAQYASYDRGATFRQIEDDFRTKHTSAHEPSNASVISLRGGGFLVAYTDTRNGGTHRVGRLGDAARNVATIEDINVGVYASADSPSLTVWEGNDGEVWALSQDATSGHGDLTLHRSVDNGYTFEGIHYLGTRPVALSNVGGAAEFKSYCGAVAGGRVLLFGKFAGTGNSSQNNSTVCVKLGGHTRHTVPAATTADQFGPTDWLAWGEGSSGAAASLWLPFTEPSNLTGWTSTTSGTAAYADTSVAGNISTTAGTLVYLQDWEHTHSSQVAEFAVAVNSGGSTGADDVSVEVAISDGTSGGAGTYTYIVSVRMSTTGWQLYDVNAGTDVGSGVSKALTSKLHFRVAMDDSGNVRVWTATDGYLRKWAENVSASGLTNTAAAHGNRLRFGHRASCSADSDWYMATVSRGSIGKYTASSGDSVAAGWTNPDDLRGREFSARPALVADGVRVSAAGGPAWKGDSWSIVAGYDYPITHALSVESPSPSEPWRSTADNVEILLTWDVEPDFATEQFLGQNLAAMAFNANVREFAVETGAAGVWTTRATAYAYADFDGLDFVRTGRVVSVDTGSTQKAARYLFRAAHAGDTLDLDSGTTLRKITANSSGAWTDSTTVRPEIQFTGATGSEPSSGTARIWRRDFGVIYAAASPAGVDQIRIRIPAHTTADGYYQIGALILGPLVLFGKPTDRGYAREVRTNVEVSTRRDGVRRAQQIGPARRALEVAWTEGFDDLSDLQRSSPVPDWVGNNGLPVASHRGTTEDVIGAVEQIGGALRTVVYLGRVDSLSGTSVQALTMPGSYLYGRVMTDTLRTEQVTGTESKDEAQRLNRVTIEGEV